MGQILVPKSGTRVFLTGPIQIFAQQGAAFPAQQPIRFDWPAEVPASATSIHCVAQTLRIPAGGQGNCDASLIISMPSDIQSAFRSMGWACPNTPGNPNGLPGGMGPNTFAEPLGLGVFDAPSDPSDPRAFYWIFKGSITDNGASGGQWGVNWTFVIDGWDLP